jgi:hypothetical protein
MFLARRAFWAFLVALPLLFSGNVFADVYDDYVPDVTDRVARISVVRGDAQIKRAGSQDWERVVPNLPIVEGDEISTDVNGRLEIQLNTRNYIRLAENSYLKITQLKDEGIALSLPQGTMSMRVMEFDKDRAYIEIDAPKTTLAVQRAGTYRVDAGDKNSTEIRLTVSETGEARVYSDNSGFTLRNGRSASIYLSGPNEGEWETADASRFVDEFDKWTLDRDAIIAKRLKDAYYDKYYDRDMYGAEDLSEYGEWIYTRKYGHVWRPYSNSVSQYADWSPYRYGSWRWVAPYGWTWINDDSWGWATYHHGRWVYDAGFWYWSPYGQYRMRRSWWMPALVVITSWNTSICWYPLPYGYSYYNNYYYNNNHHNGGWGGHHGGGNNGGNNNGGGHNGGNSNSDGNNGGGGAGGGPPVTTPLLGNPRDNVPPLQWVPPTGVITVAASDFGRDKGSIRTAPADIAKNVLSKAPDTKQTTPILPNYNDLNGKIGRDIRVEKPRNEAPVAQIKTGAAVRTNDGPLDTTLRNSRIQGDRPPLQNTPGGTGGTKVIPGTAPPEIRNTGAVPRPPVKEVREAPVYTPPIRQEPTRNDDSKGNDSSTRGNDSKPPRESPPVRQPKYEPPTPRYDPPPRNDPPPKYEPPPRNDPPPTRHDPPPKSDPPKSDPPKNDKPSAPLESGRGKSKDGR